MPRSKHTPADFHARVLCSSPDDCWPFQGRTELNGYAQFKMEQHIWYAHRLAYELAFGPIPAGRWTVRQTCDNRVCCNPRHLTLEPFHALPTAKALEQFWSHVRKTDGCWLWEGKLNNSGYGFATLNRETLFVHRLSWQLAHGPVPDGLSVLHSCDILYPPGDITSRRCVRPDHLHLGTAADNIREAFAKGRARP